MEIDTYFITMLVIQCIFYSFHLSILLLLIVKRSSNFKGAFYNIFRTVLVADFCSFISTLLAQKIPNTPYFVDFYKNSIFLPSFMTCFTSFILGIQYFGHFFMALNRFTSIWSPLKYQKIWKRQWYTVILLLIPFLTIAWRMHVNVRYTYLMNGNVLVVYADASLQPIIKVLYSTTFFIATLGALIFNGFSFGKFYYNKRKVLNYRLNEQHLLYMSIIIFIAQLGRISFSFQQLVFPGNEKVVAFFSAALPFLTDALALSGSFSFFFLSKLARREYRAFYFNIKPVVTAAVITPTTPINALTVNALIRHK